MELSKTDLCVRKFSNYELPKVRIKSSQLDYGMMLWATVKEKFVSSDCIENVFLSKEVKMSTNKHIDHEFTKYCKYLIMQIINHSL